MTRATRATRISGLLAVLAVGAACANSEPASPTPADGTPSAAESPSPTATEAGETTGAEADMTNIRILIAGQPVTAELDDNPTARALADQLPLTLSFRDLNSVEKISKLPQPLTTDGVPDGADPEIADIGYYAPSQDLVLYYGDVGYWNGIVRIGRFDDGQLLFVEGQPDGFQVTSDRRPIGRPWRRARSGPRPPYGRGPGRYLNGVAVRRRCAASARRRHRRRRCRAR